MKQKFIIFYSSILILAILISSLILNFNQFEITFSRIAGEIYIFLRYIHVPFFSREILHGYQTIFYIIAPYLIAFLLPRGLSLRQKKILRNLGYSLKIKANNDPDNYRDPKIIITKNWVDIISEVSKTLEEFQGQKEELEGVFNLNFSEALKIVNSKRITYRLIIDRFNELDPNDFVPEKPFYTYAGKNSSNHPILIPNETAPFWMIIGGSGSGKTTFLDSIMSQHYYLHRSARRICIDPKGMDITESRVESLGLEYIDASSSEGRKQALNILIEIRDCCRGANKEFLRSHAFNHAQRAFEQGLQTPLGQIFLYIDEFSRLFTAELSTYSKEDKDVLKGISDVMNDLLSTARSHGVSIYLLNQRLHLSAITLNPDNIMNLLMNGVAKEIANKYEAPIGREPVKGRWFLINEQLGNQFIKTPTKKIY